VLKAASFAALGNLLIVAAVYFMMRPNAAAFGVIASEGAAFVFLISAFRKGVQIEGDNASKAKEHAAFLPPSSNTGALMASSGG
jgi:heme/copper-type cytochrome/quinol oxidase subunit 3